MKNLVDLGQAWLVILLAFAYGGALAGVQTALAPRVNENKRQETYDVIPSLVPGADKEQTVEVIVQVEGRDERVYKIRDAGGNHLGWVLPAAGQGFADRIELLIGISADLETITGLYVLDQKETPGLGDYISQDDFQERFRGKPAEEPLVAVKSDASAPNEVLALTGATVSSWSVCTIVNDAIARLREPISQYGSKA